MTLLECDADKSYSEGEKTFAIIIGLLAGVALLIIFLTFVRKVFGGNGKIFTFIFIFLYNYGLWKQKADTVYSDVDKIHLLCYF